MCTHAGPLYRLCAYVRLLSVPTAGRRPRREPTTHQRTIYRCGWGGGRRRDGICSVNHANAGCPGGRRTPRENLHTLHSFLLSFGFCRGPRGTRHWTTRGISHSVPTVAGTRIIIIIIMYYELRKKKKRREKNDGKIYFFFLIKNF